MASIDVGGGGKSGKKSVNSEIPLIPFIDLLLCCVMFLLVTAVWNQLARLNANQQQAGQQSQVDQLDQEKIRVVLQVQAVGYVIASTAGDRLEIPKVADKYDLEGLREKLQERKRLEPNRRDMIVAPEDGVLYADIVDAMDTVVGEGFPDMILSDGSML
jgi:biopolymer transport protein ExbD